MTRTDEVSDDMLMALADGEINGTDANALHDRIDADAGLAARYAAFVETRALLKDAFSAEPVPDRLIAAVLRGAPTGPAVVPFRKRAFAVPVWGMSLAASVVLAVGGFWLGRSSTPVLTADSNIGAVTATLSTGEQMVMPDGTTLRVLASYDTGLGLCRMIAQNGLRHISCRDAQSGDWALALSVQRSDGGTFLPASDIGVGLMDSLLDDIGAGAPLAPDAERRALSD